MLVLDVCSEGTLLSASVRTVWAGEGSFTSVYPIVISKLGLVVNFVPTNGTKIEGAWHEIERLERRNIRR